MSSAGADPVYPGERLGLPADGRGSIAGIGRRLLAFIVDAALANGLAYLILGGRGPGGTYVLGMFALEMWVFATLTGATFGHLVVGLQILRRDRQPLGIWRALIRALLVFLLVPIVIWDRDQRGLHDKAIDAVLVRRR